MKFIQLLIWLSILLVNPVYSQYGGLKQITHQFAPSEWKLYPIWVNPFSPAYTTEFCVPDSSKIEADIYRIGNDGHRTLIRNLVKKKDFYYPPAVYDLDWSSAEDSLELPAAEGIYKVFVKAYSKNTDNIIFSDSTNKIYVFGWKDIGVLIKKEDLKDLDSLTVEKDTKLVPFYFFNAPSPDFSIPSIRFRRGIEGIIPDQIAIRFVLNDTNNSYRYLTYLYRCKRDSSSDYGIKILKTISYEWTKDFSKIFNYEKDEILIIKYLGYDPVVINLNDIFLRYRNECDKNNSVKKE
jgi:hypothetical protein